MPSNSMHKDITFNGKWMTADPASIGMNFQSLKNLAYTDTHLRGIRGMTNIGGSNGTTTDAWGNSDGWGNSDKWGTGSIYYLTRNAFHFVKSQPAETHLIMQKFNDMGNAILYDNTATIPATTTTTDSEISGTSTRALGYFSNAPDGRMIYSNGVTTNIWGGTEMRCGAFITSSALISGTGATTPVDYTEAMQNTKTDTENLATVGVGVRWFMVGSPVPLQGVKFYVHTPLTTVSVGSCTLAGTYWNGTSFTSMTVTDNTAVGGVTLQQTGTLTFTSTVSTAKPLYIEGYYLYWYQFAISAADSNTTKLSQVTLDAPIQPIVDLWDGVYRDVLRFYKRTTAYLDNTTNVLKDDYYSTDATTYSDLSSMSAFSDPANCLEIGFAEKQTAILIKVAPEYSNSTAATSAAVDYWNGTAYTTVGTIADGTSSGSISLAIPGVISWNANAYTDETTKIVSNSPPLYFYRVRFDKAMDASVRVNYVGGITKQKNMSYYKFSVFAQGRVLLCNDQSQEKNKLTCSGKNMPQVYNGDDSVDMFFGDEGDLTCGCDIFGQYGSSLYSVILIMKANETWAMVGQDINAWAENMYQLSASVGCPSPLTLKTIDLAGEGDGNSKSVAIWQGTNGVYLSDGHSPIPIHGDIDAYFDPTDSRCIRASKIGDSTAALDNVNGRYHLMVASGSAATTLNTELVYDIIRRKWFEIDRGSGKDLTFMAEVKDTNGASYNYGFAENGIMHRMEYGNDFDGNDIVHEVHTGDLSLGDLYTETQFDRARLITVAKTTTANNVTLTHYADGSTTGTSFTMSPARSGYRIAQPIITDKLPGNSFHSFKLNMTTDNETIGFEPLALAVTCHATHQD